MSFVHPVSHHRHHPPQYVKLMLAPASGTVLGPSGGSVTQVIRLNNSAHGQKGLAMRIKVAFKRPDGAVMDKVVTVPFPAGL